MAPSVLPATPPFDGFGTDALDFFDELEANNDREWFAANRSRYESGIAEPLRRLGDALAPAFGTPKVFRPFRDVRFSADKRPIKEQAGLLLSAGDGGLSYFQLSADGVFLAGGWWHPAKEALARFRSLVDTPDGARSARDALAEVGRDGFELAADGRLAGAPRGYPRDHPEIELLRQTSLAVGRSGPPEPWLFDASCADQVAAAWQVVGTWNRWLVEQLRTGVP
jgi:uncharacterized protein (TIGR02453 family)